MTKLRIMVAEDEALVALDLAWALEDAGVDVIGPCLSLDECLERIDSAPHIDAALLDVDLGGRDVFPAARALIARGVPILFHTAHANRSDIARDFPVARLCRKPCDVGRLVSEIRELAA